MAGYLVRMDLRTLEQVLRWFKKAQGPEHDAFYAVMEKVERDIKRIKARWPEKVVKR